MGDAILSEVLYHGTVAGQGDEFVELWNPTDKPIALAGWRIGDEETEKGNEGMYRFPESAQLEPNGTLLIARQADAFFARFGRWPDFAFRTSASANQVPLLERDAAWSSGHWSLTDAGDEVLLLDPWSRVVDRIAFRNGDFETLGLTGHDISAAAPRALHSLGTIRTDHVNDWIVYDQPTPGTPYILPEAPAAPLGPDFGGLRAAWGSFHSHSTYSDGSGPAELAFAVARANGMNFMGLSDHSHWYNQSERSRMVAAAESASQPGEFLALVGFEWTHRTEGHVNVFLTADDASRERPDGESLAAFYEWLADRPEAIATFNHPFEGNFANFAPEPAVHSQFVGLEVGNGYGDHYQRFEEGYWQALNQGWQVGAMGNLDSETPNWGGDGPLRTGVLLPALTEENLLEALRARRTFATEDRNLALALRAGHIWMGGTVEAGPLTLTGIVSDPDGEALRLELMRGETVLSSQELVAGAMPQTWEIPVDAQAGDIYLVRAVQADGDYAWSSPVWVEGEAPLPALLLTEVLAAPKSVDWDSDGTATFRDEWVELHNAGSRTVSLAGWRLEREGFGYPFPADSQIEPGQYLVLHQKTTKLSLSNSGETLRLLDPDGQEVDSVHVPFQGYDRSKARCEGTWQERREPTPGASCQFVPETPSEDEEEEEDTPSPDREDTSAPSISVEPIGEARALPAESRVTIEGIVIAQPGTFDATSMYVQDETGGIRVYHKTGLGELKVGDRVRLTGYLKLHYGEVELSVPASQSIERLARGEIVQPLVIQPGSLRDHPGELVQVVGRVEGWKGDNWFLHDGVESLYIYHDKEIGVARPELKRGQTRSVVGIVGWSEQGPRLMPRTPGDLTPAPIGGASEEGSPPRFLPNTGAGGDQPSAVSSRP